MPHSLAVLATFSSLGASATHSVSSTDLTDLFHSDWAGPSSLSSVPSFLSSVSKSAGAAFHSLFSVAGSKGATAVASGASPGAHGCSFFCTGGVPIYTGGSSSASSGTVGGLLGSHAAAGKFLGLSSHHTPSHVSLGDVFRSSNSSFCRERLTAVTSEPSSHVTATVRNVAEAPATASSFLGLSSQHPVSLSASSAKASFLCANKPAGTAASAKFLGGSATGGSHGVGEASSAAGKIHSELLSKVDDTGKGGKLLGSGYWNDGHFLLRPDEAGPTAGTAAAAATAKGALGSKFLVGGTGGSDGGFCEGSGALGTAAGVTGGGGVLGGVGVPGEGEGGNIFLLHADEAGPAAGAAAAAATKTNAVAVSSFQTKRAAFTKAAGSKGAWGTKTVFWGKKSKGGFGKKAGKGASSRASQRASKAAQRQQRQADKQAQKAAREAKRQQKREAAAQRKAAAQDKRRAEKARKREQQIEKENVRAREREQRQFEKQQKAAYKQEKARLREEQRRYQKLRENEEALDRERRAYAESRTRATGYGDRGYGSAYRRTPSYDDMNRGGYGGGRYGGYGGGGYGGGTYGGGGYGGGTYGGGGYGGGTYGGGGYGGGTYGGGGYAGGTYGGGGYAGGAHGGGGHAGAAYGGGGHGGGAHAGGGYVGGTYEHGDYGGGAHGGGGYGGSSHGAGDYGGVSHGGGGGNHGGASVGSSAVRGAAGAAASGGAPHGTGSGGSLGPSSSVQHVYAQPGGGQDGVKSIRVIQDVAETKGGVTTHHVTETTSTARSNVPPKLIPPPMAPAAGGAAYGAVGGFDGGGGDEGGDLSPLDEGGEAEGYDEEFLSLRTVKTQAMLLLGTFGLGPTRDAVEAKKHAKHRARRRKLRKKFAKMREIRIRRIEAEETRRLRHTTVRHFSPQERYLQKQPESRSCWLSEAEEVRRGGSSEIDNRDRACWQKRKPGGTCDKSTEYSRRSGGVHQTGKNTPLSTGRSALSSRSWMSRVFDEDRESPNRGQLASARHRHRVALGQWDLQETTECKSVVTAEVYAEDWAASGYRTDDSVTPTSGPHSLGSPGSGSGSLRKCRSRAFEREALQRSLWDESTAEDSGYCGDGAEWSDSDEGELRFDASATEADGSACRAKETAGSTAFCRVGVSVGASHARTSLPAKGSCFRDVRGGSTYRNDRVLLPSTRRRVQMSLRPLRQLKYQDFLA